MPVPSRRFASLVLAGVLCASSMSRAQAPAQAELDIGAAFDRARIYYESAKYSACVDAFSRLIERSESLRPRERASARTYLAACLIASNRVEEARQQFRQAILEDRQLEPPDPVEDVNIYEMSEAERKELGIESLPEDLGHAKKLLVAADVNAVPPEGVAGVGVMDDAKPLAGTEAVGIGALAIGNVKYQTQHRLLVQMRDKPKSVLGFAEAFAMARAFLAESAAKAS